jgi:arginyl-tRNA synthetase
VIAFDFKEALSFEGETGPYAQYAVVRATNIFRKAGMSPALFAGGPPDEIQRELQTLYGHEFGMVGFRFSSHDLDQDNEIWQLWLSAGQLTSVIQQCVSTTEPAYAAKYAFTLAQQFNNFYHKHHILTEADQARKAFLLVTAAVVRRALIQCLALMGITVPPVM